MKESIEKKLIENRKTNLDSLEVAALASIESAISHGFISYCFDNNFKLIDTPAVTDITGSCENFMSVFTINWFGKKARLPQTGQLYLEAFIPKFKKVFCMGPSFREEQKVDNRHAVAFNLLEIEAEGSTLEHLKEYMEGIFDYMIEDVYRNCKKDLALLGVDVEWLETFRPPYSTITYEEAIKQIGLNWGDDLKDEHEKAIVKKFGNKPVFVTHYPQEMKYFNMKLNKQNPKIVNSMDLLLPFSGEAGGAAERENVVRILEKRLDESTMIDLTVKKLIEESQDKRSYEELKKEVISKFDWYIDLIRRYQAERVGCGIGKNRVTQALLASNDIRACSVYFINKENLI